MIRWELCKKLKFDYTTECYIHKPESLIQNETHTILWGFEIQTDPLIPTRRPELVITTRNRTCFIVDFAVSADHTIKKKRNERQALRPC